MRGAFLAAVQVEAVLWRLQPPYPTRYGDAGAPLEDQEQALLRLQELVHDGQRYLLRLEEAAPMPMWGLDVEGPQLSQVGQLKSWKQTTTTTAALEVVFFKNNLRHPPCKKSHENHERVIVSRRAHTQHNDSFDRTAIGQPFQAQSRERLQFCVFLRYRDRERKKVSGGERWSMYQYAIPL